MRRGGVDRRASGRRSCSTPGSATRPGRCRSSDRPRSSIYNKDAFAKAGLDPDHYPADWKAQAEAAQKLTKGEGEARTWGIEFAGDIANAHWAFGALCAGNDQDLMNAAGTKVYFDAPKTVETLEYWVGLNKTWQGHAAGDHLLGDAW